MELSPSAHVDTFCRDNLPAATLWPAMSFELPELNYPERLNCATALLDDIVATHGADRPCLLSPGETWTYGRLLARSNQIAGYLADERGLVPGQRVLLRGPNNPWLVACWFGVLKAGGVVVATVPLLRAAELRPLIGLTQCSLVLCDHRFAADMTAVVADAGIALVLYGGDGEDDLVASSATKPATFTNVDTAADDVALLAPTSGTTGSPKATMHFHRDVLAIADTFGKHIVRGVTDDVFAGTPPLAFTFGLGGLVIFPLRIGASTLLLERATPVELAEAVERFRATVLCTAPTAYRAILRAGREASLRSLRRAVSAGEHLPQQVWEEFHAKTTIKLIDGIGSTEMLHVFISAADDDIRPGATGRAVPGYQAAVFDQDGQPAPDGTPGRLGVRGPTGCRYLADNRQTTYVQDGWNMTGDTYIRDADGYFWYQARSDDMVISSGYNIAAPEVEWALEQHPDVVECAVVGQPDIERGMVVHAVVVLRENVTGDAAKIVELQAFAKEAIAPYKYPRSIEFVAALPRTTTGKLQRFRLRQRQAAQ
ncbi:MAG TPA: AMP-binding protein [Mycobacteriales bacterium]|jgi:2-aminobenzoate-CoA ligase|nr:AMP-binding protein [Mycobacteriales bacterium]